ncbi:MAG: glycosyltransferase family protein [Lachnospiraceae bacterium]
MYMTREEYIYKAVEMEEKNMQEAIRIVNAGCGEYPCDYELHFMKANYAYCSNEKERAYVYYQLALSLCDNEDQEIIRENFSIIDTEQLTAKKVREELENCIKERLLSEEYTGTYQFVTKIIFSDDPFLFHQVIDQWLRYYYSLLEVISCEANHGGICVKAKKYADWRIYEKDFIKYKFAIRRVWFNFPHSIEDLIEQVQRDGVSVDFLAVLIKYSVPEKYVASMMEEISFYTASKLLKLYANWYRGINETNISLPQYIRKKQEHNVRIMNVVENKEPLDEWEESSPDEHKIAYILCVNDERYSKEIIEYLSYQILPEGYQMEILVVKNAKSMTMGYNFAMRHSNARYKIYIHQDTFIFDPYYTQNLIQILDEGGYQMLGVAGAEYLPENGVWWDCEPYAKKMCLYQDMVISILQSTTIKEETCTEVECLDGVLLATNRDLVWREDLFNHFHFYDISQSEEFRRKGYRIAVYNNRENVGVLHETSVNKSEGSKQAYEDARIQFLKEYKKI